VKALASRRGKVMQMADYSELELRVMADLGLDVRGDLHEMTAEAILRT